MTLRLVFVGFIVSLMWLMMAFVCRAADVDFTWSPNTDADLAGYRVFQRTAGATYDYTTPVAEIPAGIEVCTLADIPDGDYRWVMRAFDAAGQESVDSNECSLAIDDPPGPVQGFG